MISIKFFPISILTLIMSTVACQSTQDIKSTNGPTGSAAIKQSVTYKIHPSDEKGTLLEKRFFNQDGQTTMFYAYDYYGSGEIEDSTSYFYNDQGQKMKEVSYGNETTTTFSYNDQGNLLEKAWSRPNGQGETAKHTYNGSRDLTEIKYYDAKGKYDFSRTFELGYDRKGRVIEEKKWEKYSDGSADLLMYHMGYEYDSSDSLLVKERYRANGKADKRTEYTYDAQGRLSMEMDISLSNGVEKQREKTAYHLNDAGKTVKDESFSIHQGKETLSYTNSYKYNKYGHQTWMMYKHADGSDTWGERIAYQYY